MRWVTILARILEQEFDHPSRCTLSTLNEVAIISTLNETVKQTHNSYQEISVNLTSLVKRVTNTYKITTQMSEYSSTTKGY